MAGLLTRSTFKAFPSKKIMTVAEDFESIQRNLQQRELLPILTAFPIK